MKLIVFFIFYYFMGLRTCFATTVGPSQDSYIELAEGNCRFKKIIQQSRDGSLAMLLLVLILRYIVLISKKLHLDTAYNKLVKNKKEQI